MVILSLWLIVRKRPGTYRKYFSHLHQTSDYFVVGGDHVPAATAAATALAAPNFRQ